MSFSSFLFNEYLLKDKTKKVVHHSPPDMGEGTNVERNVYLQGVIGC